MSHVNTKCFNFLLSYQPFILSLNFHTLSPTSGPPPTLSTCQEVQKRSSEISTLFSFLSPPFSLLEDSDTYKSKHQAIIPAFQVSLALSNL